MYKSKIVRTVISAVVFVTITLGVNGWTSFKRVYVHSEANDSYLAQRSPDKPESYYFFEGVYFGGHINDKSLRNMKFIDIARGLAPHLAKQDYWPAKSKESCDLLLIVSWGTTTVNDTADFYLDFYDGSNFNDLLNMSYAYNQMNWHDDVRASKLIGFYPYLHWDRYEFMPHIRGEDYELRQALRTERYFMIVTAFDFQALINEKRWNRVWSTRFSMRSPGINFKKAHLALSKAGGAYFGKNVESLGKERANFDPIIADVEIGEIEVLETIDVPRGRGMQSSIRLSGRR